MSETVGPVTGRARIIDMDVLRGVALFGVFLVNMTGFAGEGVMATGAQLAALPTHAADQIAHQLVEWLAGNKANTTFAFLFGLGFYLMMERAEAKGPGFARLYARRLTVLLVFGWLHLALLWGWDILHLYAMAGFALLALRRVSSRVLLGTATVLLLLPWKMFELVGGVFGIDVTGGVDIFSDAEVHARQAASLAGDYPALVASMWHYTSVDYLLSGQIFGWFLYALGRFAAGAWVGRRGWLQNADAVLPGFRRVFRICLPLGLVLSGVHVLLVDDSLKDTAWHLVGEVMTSVSAAVLVAGYLSGIVLALRTPLGQRLFAPFRFSGQMALTNYVMQSLIYGFVLFGVGPGLALAGRIGTCAVIAIVVVAYAGQIAFSAWWLARYRFGPLEWVWRTLTYGERPGMRRTAVAA